MGATYVTDLLSQPPLPPIPIGIYMSIYRREGVIDKLNND